MSNFYKKIDPGAFLTSSLNKLLFSLNYTAELLER